MTDNEAGSADKRGWPDMRTLRWPPEGVEGTPLSKARADALVSPVEFTADPERSGMFVAVSGTENTVMEPEPEPIPADPAEQGVLILNELRTLRKAVDTLTGIVRTLSSSNRIGGGGNVGPARCISDHQGRQEIQEYFLNHADRTVYPKEIAEALNLPVLKVAELCETMALRGQINRTLEG